MIRPSEGPLSPTSYKDPYLPFHSSESLESLKGPQTLGQVEIITPSYIHKHHWPPGATLRSISTNSEGRTCLPPSWEARAKRHPLGTETQAKEVKQVSTLRASKSWGLGQFRLPSAGALQVACHLPLPGPGGPKVLESRRNLSRSHKAVEIKLPIYGDIRSRPGFRKRCKPCSDPSQETSAAPALFRPAPTGPRTLFHSAPPGGQAHLGPQRTAGAKGRRSLRPAAQPWRVEPGGGRRGAPEAGTLRTTIPTRPCGKPREWPLPQHKLSWHKIPGKKKINKHLFDTVTLIHS